VGDYSYPTVDPETTEKFRAKMESGPRFLKIRGGETKYLPNFLRILPPHDNMVNPETGKHTWFWPVSVHYNVGPPGAARTIACRKKMELGRCPVCETSFRLRNQGLDKEADRLRPTWNSYANVVKLDDAGDVVDNNIYVMAIRPKLSRAIDDEFENLGDLTHMEEGRNIVIRRLREDLHSEYKLQLTDPCPFPGDPEIVENRYDLTQIVTYLSEGEVEALIEGGQDDPFEELGGGASETPRLKKGAIPMDAEESAAVEGEFREVEGEQEGEEDEELEQDLAKIGEKLREKLEEEEEEEEPSDTGGSTPTPEPEPAEKPKPKRGRPKKSAAKPDTEPDPKPAPTSEGKVGGAALGRLRKSIADAE